MQLVYNVIILKLAGHRVHVGATGLRQHAGGGIDEQLRELHVREVDVGVVDARKHSCGFANAFPELRRVFVSGEFVASVALSCQILRAVLKPIKYACCAEEETVQYSVIQITEFEKSHANHPCICAIIISHRDTYRRCIPNEEENCGLKNVEITGQDRVDQ